jgi:hypothetical protein
MTERAQVVLGDSFKPPNPGNKSRSRTSRSRNPQHTRSTRLSHSAHRHQHSAHSVARPQEARSRFAAGRRQQNKASRCRKQQLHADSIVDSRAPACAPECVAAAPAEPGTAACHDQRGRRECWWFCSFLFAALFADFQVGLPCQTTRMRHGPTAAMKCGGMGPQTRDGLHGRASQDGKTRVTTRHGHGNRTGTERRTARQPQE